ncbi:MAG TPA: butyrate kinase [Bacteroidales bacterium]|nr:butyrate kinase [Bacteroidales bacterium]
MEKRLILAINPGSTSTKIGLFEEESPVFEKSINHSRNDLVQFEKIADQFQFRKELIMTELSVRKVELEKIRIVVGRGGLVKPIESGIYRINQEMLDDLRSGFSGQHASNLGGLIADEIASLLPSAEAFIVDPVVVDELHDIARISGHPAIERRSIFHALNQKAVARLYASSVGRRYEDINLIVAHLGGGISVGAHLYGRVVDVNNALDGDGPFSPERSGTLPAGQLAELCFSGKYSREEIKSILTGKGGMVAYLGTNSFKEICNMAERGDNKAIMIVNAVSYQVAKEIGAMASVLHGKVDAIILTGGMAYQESTVDDIRRRVEYISKVVVYPGEDEMKALAFNALLALDGKLEIKTYS